MIVLSKKQLSAISGANSEENTLLINLPETTPPKNYKISTKTQAFITTTGLFNGLTTAILKPNLPLWGLPVTLSLGLAIGAVMITSDLIWPRKKEEIMPL